MRCTALAVVLTLSTAAVATAAVLSSSFLGAGAGTEVPFVPVVLPQPSSAPESELPLVRLFKSRSAFTPTQQQLLEGETIITTEKQMREVWDRLFSEPYDAAQFDFHTSFVVFMGGGSIANGTFDISAVEQVEASYANPGGFEDRPSETFLSVTATTFLSGVQPVEEPPPASWRVAAVRISRTLLDDVVFRRNVILGI